MTAMTKNSFIMNSTGKETLHSSRLNGTVISARVVPPLAAVREKSAILQAAADSEQGEDNRTNRSYRTKGTYRTCMSYTVPQ